MHKDAGSNIADMYAEALYDAARPTGVLPDIEEDLLAVRRAVAGDPRFLRFLDVPSVPLAEKRRVLRAVLAGAHPIVVNFLSVLLDRGRLELFDAIMEAFRDHCDHQAGVAEFRVASARPLEESERAALVELLTRRTGRTIRLTCECRPELLGGLVLAHEDQRWNASLQHQLAQLMQDVAAVKSGMIVWTD